MLYKMKIIFCPYLDRNVILTDERYDHIKKQHPELLPEFEYTLEHTIANPDTVRKSSRFINARLFTKYFDNIRNGKYIVVVIVNDAHLETRDWIITAYMTRKLSDGVVEWEKK